jgi:hypothetical protein
MIDPEDRRLPQSDLQRVPAMRATSNGMFRIDAGSALYLWLRIPRHVSVRRAQTPAALLRERSHSGRRYVYA